MSYLIFNLISLGLLFGFLALSVYETRSGSRMFADTRARLDGYVIRASFIFAHVDFKAFIREIAIRVGHRVAHDIAHFSLLIVRAVERFLTRVVRYLRTRRAADIVPHENTREFVRTLSDFKGQLEDTRPDVPDILE